MAEQNITCPHCLSDKQCFQEEVKVENFSSYQCFNCGFMSNSLYTNDSDALKRIQDSTTDLMNEISCYLSNVGPSQLIQLVLEKSGYLNELLMSGTEESEERRNNLQELIPLGY